MNWDDLRVIAAVNKTGSYTRAARLLEVEETTVARRVTRIESTLGIPLFEAKDGVRQPTESCQAILTDLAAMEQAADHISAQLQHQQMPRRNLRLSTIEAIADHFLAPALGELLESQPDLTLLIETTDQVVDMSRWEADLAIRLGRPKHGTFTMRKIGEIRFMLVIPRHAKGEEVTVAAYPDQFLETPEMCELFAIYPPRLVRMKTSNLCLFRRFVECETGVAVLPDFLCRDLMDDPRFEIREMEARRELWLLAQAHLRDDPVTRRIGDWCAGLFNRA